MPKGEKSFTDTQKRQARAIHQGSEPQAVARPGAGARAWASVNRLHDGGKKGGSRRKVPFGPVGGSGRKTNLARSS